MSAREGWRNREPEGGKTGGKEEEREVRMEKENSILLKPGLISLQNTL